MVMSYSSFIQLLRRDRGYGLGIEEMEWALDVAGEPGDEPGIVADHA
jgi:hypothetical protein